MDAISPLFMPTAIFHAQISFLHVPLPKEKKCRPYERSHVEWFFEKKVQNDTVLKLTSGEVQQMVFFCCASVAGWGYWAQSRMWGGYITKGFLFLYCGLSFLIKTVRTKACFWKSWREQLLDVLVVQLQLEENLLLRATPTVLAL